MILLTLLFGHINHMSFFHRKIKILLFAKRFHNYNKIELVSQTILRGAYMNLEYSIFPLGNDEVVLHIHQQYTRFSSQLIMEVKTKISENPFPGFLEAEASFSTVTLYYDPSYFGTADSFQMIKDHIEKILKVSLKKIEHQHQPINIPVCYDRQLAPHLDEVAHANKMSVQEFIRVHSEKTYYVSFLGFGDGVPFLGGVNEALTAPKKNSIELYVPFGSVGITGNLTGIFPIGTVVGWKLVGRSPARVLRNLQPFFTPDREIRFVPISLDEYYLLEYRESEEKIPS